MSKFPEILWRWEERESQRESFWGILEVIGISSKDITIRSLYKQRKKKKRTYNRALCGLIILSGDNSLHIALKSSGVYAGLWSKLLTVCNQWAKKKLNLINHFTTLRNLGVHAQHISVISVSRGRCLFSPPSGDRSRNDKAGGLRAILKASARASCYGFGCPQSCWKHSTMARRSHFQPQEYARGDRHNSSCSTN
jgi:hypothetical protein